jgi:flagellar protein FliL
MKKLLIILVFLLVLGGGGAAAWWFYFRADPNAPPPPPPPPELSQLTIPEEKNGAFNISVIKNGKIEKRFLFRFTLIFDAAEKRETADKAMPLLVNAFNEELHGLLARKLVEESNYDLNLIQYQLQKVCDRVLGKGIVSQVSIANMEPVQ